VARSAGRKSGGTPTRARGGKSFAADPAQTDYVERTFLEEDPLLADVIERSRAAGLPEIQVARSDARHLEVLARAIGARRTVEIGTLGGYSGVCLVRGMDDHGVLHTFEAVERHAEVARETFARAGASARAKIHVGPALIELPKIEGEGPFDLVFIDADKESYPAYLAWAGKNLRIGGVVLGDNAFLHGKLLAPLDAGSADATKVRAMLAFNDALARGGRFRATMLPTGEGLAMGVKVR
jgi:caffeoyl-CoA O-methyltransferase